jgi:hypothetical protein
LRTITAIQGFPIPSPLYEDKETSISRKFWEWKSESDEKSRKFQKILAKERLSFYSLPKNPDSPKIVEAQGWIVDANGDVILVAQAPTVNPIPVFSCHV